MLYVSSNFAYALTFSNWPVVWTHFTQKTHYILLVHSSLVTSHSVYCMTENLEGHIILLAGVGGASAVYTIEGQ